MLEEAEESLQISNALESASELTRAAIEQDLATIEPHIIESRIELLEKQIQELKEHGRSREERDTLTQFRIDREELKR